MDEEKTAKLGEWNLIQNGDGSGPYHNKKNIIGKSEEVNCPILV